MDFPGNFDRVKPLSGPDYPEFAVEIGCQLVEPLNPSLKFPVVARVPLSTSRLNTLAFAMAAAMLNHPLFR
jgi:hypothetical protein